ncbi:aldo/keto reductase [Streptococcus pseudoporcinus]|uniref:Oxidoreductase, aldo/keto reductase family protein n=1 Tax=Streptococcus pseudoporcinus LQ 940-04 TaxID=875093 RepID=G5KAL8_9STRE|nr:aldo/keto reductase [Streptococcus pseudoporcinus]EFR44621.1 oxidoreductase, aldo/keto reductase family protein [Streptococcus pseudoporcinus SPIN 20026]EHI64269.1 oxidoreductase, aldo/keto reductase family protein [Streptococcus pseudoporcinus LQ 940-04]VEF93100.1 aldo/keto reductase [Streptococcus pseudoporcinus]
MIETFKMSDGNRIPSLGVGTWLISDEKAEVLVSQALKLGYRHIDTAQAYGNEVGVGKGLFLSGLPREEIFLTSKVAAELKSYQAVTASIDASLNKLGLNDIDLMLIHSPQPWNKWRDKTNDYDQGNLEAWRALEDAQKAGKVKSIGLSNFLREDIENILKNGQVKPAVNQILTHVGNVPFDLIEYCQREGILLEAYSPIAHGQVLKDKTIQELAKKYAVSPASLCIKYVHQLGMVALPKTENPEHLLSNMMLDFNISRHDMALLNKLQFTDYGNYSTFPVFSGK